MPTERFDTFFPYARAGKRIYKSKLDLALGATGVLRPYPQNTERLIERKILLQTPFGSGGGGPPLSPADSTAAAALAYWRMDGATGTDETDTTGHGHLLQCNVGNQINGGGGTAGIVKIGTFRFWFTFGFSPIMECTGPVDTRASSAPFSVAGWFYDAGGPSSGFIVGQWLASAQGCWAIYNSGTTGGANGGMLPQVAYVDSTNTQFAPAFVATNGFFAPAASIAQFLALVFDGTNLTLYNNLVNVGSTVANGVRRDVVFSFSMFGNHPANLNNPGAWEEWGFYNKALSAAELSYLYNSGAGARPTGL